MYAENMSEVLHTLAAFAEMLDVAESIGGWFGQKAYSSQCTNNEMKKELNFETWATDSSGIGTDLTNDSRTNETTSSRSSTPIDNNILDDCLSTDKHTKEEYTSQTSGIGIKHIEKDIPAWEENTDPKTTSFDSKNITESEENTDPKTISEDSKNIPASEEIADPKTTSEDSKNIPASEEVADPKTTFEDSKNIPASEEIADPKTISDEDSKNVPASEEIDDSFIASKNSQIIKTSGENVDPISTSDNSKNVPASQANTEPINVSNDSKNIPALKENANPIATDDDSKKIPALKENANPITACVNSPSNSKTSNIRSSLLNEINSYNNNSEYPNHETKENVSEESSNKFEKNACDLNIDKSGISPDIEKVSDINKVLPAEVEDESELYSVKKFNTSSWNLEAITESLYAITEPKSLKSSSIEPPSKSHGASGNGILEDGAIFQTTVFVMNEGSFMHYSPGHYILELYEHKLQIKQEANILISIPLTYAEVCILDGNVLKVDNRLGKCLYFKSDTQKELTELFQQLEFHCSKSWESETLQLVHYPMKCHQNVVIVDLGSCSTRAGILMDQPTLPFLFFPSICATDRKTGNHVYGKEALQSKVRQNSNLSFPLRPSETIIKHSIDIDLIGGLFKKIFKELRVDPTQYVVQVCLPRSLSISAKNALLKLLLEEVKVQSVSLTHQALLTLYAHKVSTGIVVDIGDRMDILPVVDGFIVDGGVTRLTYGGQRLIHHMKHALAQKHISLSNDIDSFVVQYIAENLSYVAEDYDSEMQMASQYPDMVKKTIMLDTFARDDKCAQSATLDDARFKTPEGLFKPELWGLDSPGVHKLVHKAIHATGVDVRKKIAEHIYVSGGVTMIPGFVERLIKEVSQLNKPRIVPKVIASNYRYHCTYIGACEFAKMDVFPKVCVNLDEYNKDQTASLKKFVLCF